MLFLFLVLSKIFLETSFFKLLFEAQLLMVLREAFLKGGRPPPRRVTLPEGSKHRPTLGVGLASMVFAELASASV